MKRYRSFTVVELLVVMLLTAILSILIGGALVNMSQYRRLLDHRSKSIKELSRLHYLLESDNFNASRATFEADCLVFVIDSIQVVYNMYSTGTIRKQLTVSDTFPYLLYQEGQTGEIGDMPGLLAIRLISSDSSTNQDPSADILLALSRWQSSTQEYNSTWDEH